MFRGPSAIVRKLQDINECRKYLLEAIDGTGEWKNKGYDFGAHTRLELALFQVNLALEYYAKRPKCSFCHNLLDTVKEG